MKYVIELYETFDSNGVMIVALFLELDGQIYNCVRRYVKNKDKYITIARCFLEIGMMIMMRKVK